MRSDLERIKNMIEDYEGDDHNFIPREKRENAVLRELLTSWQGLYAHEYQSDVKLHLNMLTKRMLEGNKVQLEQPKD